MWEHGLKNQKPTALTISSMTFRSYCSYKTVTLLDVHVFIESRVLKTKIPSKINQ